MSLKSELLLDQWQTSAAAFMMATAVAHFVPPPEWGAVFVATLVIVRETVGQVRVGSQPPGSVNRTLF